MGTTCARPAGTWRMDACAEKAETPGDGRGLDEAYDILGRTSTGMRKVWVGSRARCRKPIGPGCRDDSGKRLRRLFAVDRNATLATNMRTHLQLLCTYMLAGCLVVGMRLPSSAQSSATPVPPQRAPLGPNDAPGAQGSKMTPTGLAANGGSMAHDVYTNSTYGFSSRPERAATAIMLGCERSGNGGGFGARGQVIHDFYFGSMTDFSRLRRMRAAPCGATQFPGPLEARTCRISRLSNGR